LAALRLAEQPEDRHRQLLPQLLEVLVDLGLALGGGEHPLELGEHGVRRPWGRTARRAGAHGPPRGETVAHLAHTTSCVDAQTVPTSLPSFYAAGGLDRPCVLRYLPRVMKGPGAARECGASPWPEPGKVSWQTPIPASSRSGKAGRGRLWKDAFPRPPRPPRPCSSPPTTQTTSTPPRRSARRPCTARTRAAPSRTRCSGSLTSSTCATTASPAGCRHVWSSPSTPARRSWAWASASAPTGSSTPVTAPRSSCAA